MTALNQKDRVPTHFPPNMGRTLGIGVAILAVALIVGYFFVHHRQAKLAASLAAQVSAKQDAPPVVEVARVQYSAGTEPFAMPGTTRGWYQSTIYARVDGYVQNWTADIGDHVKAGQVLATIDTPDLDARLAAAQAKLAAAESDVDVAESNLDLARVTNQRWRNSPPGVVSEQERDEKSAEYKSSLSKLKAAQAQAKVDQAEVTNLLAFTRYKNVTAPFEGVITARKIDIGDLVSAGSTSNMTFLYGVAEIDRIRVFVDVPQAASAGLKVGMAANVTSNEFPGRKFEGKITRTANAIDPDSLTLHVEVDIPNPDTTLVPGMYVKVAFVLRQNRLLQVPASALLFRAAGTDVAIVGDDGKVHFEKVDIANDRGDVVEIVSKLSATACVALNLSNQIAEGEKVTPKEVSQPDRPNTNTAQTSAQAE